jgi:hypothetical protein
MSFEEKSTWAMMISVPAVYSWYFITLLAALPDDSALIGDVQYRGALFSTVVGLVLIAAVAHAGIAAYGPDDADERDREINRWGEYSGGYVTTSAALTGLGMAVFEIEYFWFANTILLLLVVSELVSSGIKIYFYRRGF